MPQQIRQITQKSPDFPKILLEIPYPPKTLNVWGKIPKTEHYLSIVGTRKNSAYGEEILRKIITGLAPHNFTIVSGLANGIDSIAHRSALENNIPTVAVLGSGLNRGVLSYSKIGLAEEIVSRGGAIISEFENSMKATLWSFPQRNRIISGLSKATLIVEAGEKSGTLEKSMAELSEQFDMRVSTRLKTMTTLIEPMLLLVVGLMVGALMLAIIAPIYNLIGKISPR